MSGRGHPRPMSALPLVVHDSTFVHRDDPVREIEDAIVVADHQDRGMANPRKAPKKQDDLAARSPIQRCCRLVGTDALRVADQGSVDGNKWLGRRTT